MFKAKIMFETDFGSSLVIFGFVFKNCINPNIVLFLSIGVSS